MKTLDDKLKEQAQKSIKPPEKCASALKGFQLHLSIFQKLLKTLALPAIKASKSYAISRKKEISNQCFDKQDLHLMHFYEISSAKTMPKRKIWNVRLPSTIALTKSTYNGPITHRKVVLKEKEL
ncbi:MAG: hypothetical protein KDK50_04310 [Chlamydiia bacterium]|nr:hypothetical protein [Chlamydiia bacterium]